MAFRVANSDTTIDSATGWDTGTNVPTIHASTNITVSTTLRYTATFTAPNTTNACTGVILYMSDNSFVDLIVTLQESTVDTAATVTVDPTSFGNGSFIYVRFPAPYTFTTTSANAYRFKIVASSGSGNVAADSGGSLFAFLATDNRQGILAATDTPMVIGHNGTTDITATVNADYTTGSGTESNILPTQRSWGGGIYVSSRGKLAWSTVASANLTVNKGNVVIYSGGTYERGTVASPMPSGVVATMTFDENGLAGNYGVRVFTGGKYYDQGAPKPDTTNWKANYSAGSGTTASPLTVPSGWEVGDHFTIGAQVYTEIEYKFIISKPSSTTAVIADTKGGVEAGFTNVHVTTDEMVNLERNVVTVSTSNVYGFFIYNGSLIDGDFDIDWARYEFTGSTLSSRTGVLVVGTTNVYGDCDYSVFWRPRYTGLQVQTSKRALTFNGIVVAGENTSQTSTIGAINISTANNKTFNDCFVIGNRRIGVFVSACASIVYNRLRVIGCNTVANTTYGGVYLSNANLVQLNDCDIHANRVNGIALVGTAGSIASDSRIGTLGTNTTDVLCTLDTYNEMLFDNCLFGSATRISGYADQIAGSIIKFHKLDQTDNNHTWYTANGQGRSTGAGLSDTTVKTAGSLGLRLAPESAEGIKNEYKVLAKPDTAVSALGFVRMNTTFTGDANTVLTVNLYLPGSTVADATATITKTPDTWLVYNLAASYTGDVTAYATVEVLATNPDATASAYVYHDDIFNGTNEITAVDVWDEGQPSEIMFETLGDAAAVWAVSTSTLTTAGTVGNHLAKKVSTKSVPKY